MSRVINRITKALPDIPPTIDEHPRWRQHQADLQRLTKAVETTQTAIATLEEEHDRVRVSTADDAVAEAIGEDQGATARVIAGKQRLTELSQQIANQRERLDVQQEAVRRITARTDDVRAAIRREIDDIVLSVYRELLAQLAQKLAAVGPINDRLLELRARHSDSSALREGVWFDELQPRVIHGLPNKLEAWLRVARSHGLEV